jgi:formate dehydrogenase iron-sulfur subunit
VAKPLAVAGMIGAALVGFFHYMKVGPIEEKPEGKPEGDSQEKPEDEKEPS